MFFLFSHYRLKCLLRFCLLGFISWQPCLVYFLFITKSFLQNQAMRVVRTVGQAFEVVHKMTQKDKSPSPEPPLEDNISREGSEYSSDKPKKGTAYIIS